MRALRYSIPFAFLATAPLGFVLGGAWSFLTVALVPMIICGFDQALGFEAGSQTAPDGLGYRALPWLYICAQIVVTAWATAALAGPRATLVEVLGLTASVGMTTGVFGMLAAHEMVHSRVPVERALGLAMLATVGDMQFRIAHIHGHHLRAATPEDPASARRGESAYRFVVRSVVGQTKEAWAFEAIRLRRKGRHAFGPSNRVLFYLVVEILVVAAVARLGLRPLAFWFGQAALAIILLELFNYIAHYGLARHHAPGGGFERLGPQHSWNSSRRMNNWSLFNMGRHSDHHRRPARAYQALEAEPCGPELPTGYAGAILLCLAPPLWRKTMDPKVDLWAAGIG